MNLEFVLETLITIGLTIYYIAESIFRTIFRLKPPRKEIKNEIVLVTGAASGIGRLMSIKFARLGAIVVMVDVNKSANEEAAEEIQTYGGTTYAFSCNLCNREEVYALAEKVRQQVGVVHILVNNAGVVTGKNFMDCPDHLIERSMDVNINAHYWTVKAFLPDMLKANRGHIVSIASSAGLFGAPRLADYCASKFAAVGFMESLGLELRRANHDIKLTTVGPYFINTGMFDGAKSRFPQILGILDAEDTSGVIVDSILRDQELLLIPKLMYTLLALKGILPIKATRILLNYFGANEMMDEFNGRGEQKSE